jgi:putative hemolysin
MDILLLLILILFNGLFAMSEMALSASRKARLQVMVEAQERGAQAAMDLHDNPTKFLSTVQIGITSIGILNGIVGEAVFAVPFATWMQSYFPISKSVASISATALVVLVITFLTIILGELVPKRIGQLHPETVARFIAPPMEMLSLLTRPFVAFLMACTHTVLRLLGLEGSTGPSVTEEEIAASLEEGLESGVIEEQEHQMVRNVFRLDERQAVSMMVPRADVIWLDAEEPVQNWIHTIARTGRSRYPVCRESLSDVLGVLLPGKLLPLMEGGDIPPLEQYLEPPVFVPETLSGMELLEQFRSGSSGLAFVVDEYGQVQGLVTLRDVLEAITGEFNVPADGDSWAVQREDGSWLLDGLIPATELKDRLEMKEIPDENRGRYNTLAGMVMLLLGRLPKTGDSVQWEGWRLEVIDLDGRRIDKVLAVRILLPQEG